jgi:hypothetical protein
MTGTQILISKTRTRNREKKSLRHVPELKIVTTPVLVHWDAWDSNFFIQN